VIEYMTLIHGLAQQRRLQKNQNFAQK